MTCLVLAPIHQVRRFAVKMSPKGVCPLSLGRLNIAKFPLILRGNINPIAVEWQKCVFKLEKLFKIISPRYPYSGTMISIAPGNIVSVFNKAYPWVITINPFSVSGSEFSNFKDSASMFQSIPLLLNPT
jgi:hypothetical protein